MKIKYKAGFPLEFQKVVVVVVCNFVNDVYCLA